MEPEPPGAASFSLEPEPTQVGWSRSRLRDLGHQEPEPPKKSGGSATLLYDEPRIFSKWGWILGGFVIICFESGSRQT